MVVTVCAAISVDATDSSPVVGESGDEGVEHFRPFESLPFEDRIALLDEVEEALIESIERHI